MFHLMACCCSSWVFPALLLAPLLPALVHLIITLRRTPCDIQITSLDATFTILGAHLCKPDKEAALTEKEPGALGRLCAGE